MNDSQVLLCLSGGGFRAAAFHLGVVRRLLEAGVLTQLDEIRTVSGGSLLAAYIAAVEARTGRPLEAMDRSEFETEIARPMRAFLARDLRTLPFLVTLPCNWRWKGPRLRLLERALTRRLCDLRLGAVHDKWCFVATDLNLGVEIALRAGRLPPIWEHLRAAADAVDGVRFEQELEFDDWPLVRAAIASAAFPVAIGPMRVRARYVSATEDAMVHELALSDGGVLGNVGVPLLADRLRLVVSDASYAREAKRAPRIWFLRALKVSMSWSDIRALAGAGWANERISVIRIGDAALDGRHGYGPGLSRAIAAIRTDLDAFTPDEIGILENQGYVAADRAIVEQLDDLVVEGTCAGVPHPALLDERVAWLALCGSGRRFGKFRAISRLRQRLRWKWGDPVEA